MAKKHWIADAVKNKGAYGHHSITQIHEDEKKGGKIAKRASLAETLRGFNKK